MLCYRCGSYTPDGSRECTVCGEVLAQDRRVKAFAGTTPPYGRPTPPLLSGSIFAGHYRIGDPAGMGASGWVLRAHDTRDEHEVAIKIMATNLLQTDEDRDRFSKAVRSYKRIQWPALVPVLEEGQDAQCTYYIMPFIEGISLRRIMDLRLEKGALFGFSEVVPALQQLGPGLDALGHGHGAVRPHNMIVTATQLYITGAAHLAGLPRRPFVVSQTALQTRAYLAPEARHDTSEVDLRADVYAVAVLVTEMLTGKVHGRDHDVWDVAQRILPPSMVSVLRRNVSDSPTYRMLSVCQLVDALQAANARADRPAAPLHGPPPPAPPRSADPVNHAGAAAAMMEPVPHGMQRASTMVVAGLILLTGLLVSAGLWLRQRPFMAHDHGVRIHSAID